jgi:hypothetical protein
MAKFKIVVTEIKDAFQPNTEGNVTTDTEVFRQVIDDLNLAKFVRTLNATPRRSRKTKADASKA